MRQYLYTWARGNHSGREEISLRDLAHLRDLSDEQVDYAADMKIGASFGDSTFLITRIEDIHYA